MDVTLSVDAAPRRTVVVTFTNTAPTVQWLAGPRAGAGTPDGNYFEMTPPAPYLGISTKRGPYHGGELLLLEPGTSASYAVDLDALYDVGETNVERRLRYGATHPLGGDETMTLLRSEWVTLP